jgi:hypothetical protein
LRRRAAMIGESYIREGREEYTREDETAWRA